VSLASVKIQIGFTFLVPAHPGSPGQKAIKCVCVVQRYNGIINDCFTENSDRSLKVKEFLSFQLTRCKRTVFSLFRVTVD